MTTKSLNKYYDVISAPHLVNHLAMYQLLSNINKHIKPIFLSILKKIVALRGLWILIQNQRVYF